MDDTASSHLSYRIQHIIKTTPYGNGDSLTVKRNHTDCLATLSSVRLF